MLLSEPRSSYNVACQALKEPISFLSKPFFTIYLFLHLNFNKTPSEQPMHPQKRAFSFITHYQRSLQQNLRITVYVEHAGAIICPVQYWFVDSLETLEKES